MRKALLVFWFFALSVATAEDLTTFEGQIEFLERVIRRYPGIASRNLLYRRNFLELLSHLPELKKKLGADFGDTELPKQSTLLTQYYQGADAAPNPKKIEELKDSIKKNLTIQKTLGELVSFEKDLAKLSTKSLIRQFLIAAPFLYDETSGKPLESPSERLQKAKAADIEQAYQDTLRLHLWPRAKATNTAKEAYNNIENTFQKEVASALTPVSPNGKPTAQKAVSIERVPSSVGMFRFFCGKDCSIQSVPFHAMLSSAKVYFIYPSDRATSDPSGYAFVVEAKHKGKKIPYVLTLNGSLNREATRSTLSLIAQDLGSKQILLPDFDRNAAVVNGDTMRSHLSFESAKKVKVDLGQKQGWNEVDKFSRKLGRTQYDDYYDFERQSAARLIGSQELDWTPAQPQTIDDPFPNKEHSNHNALLERALLAAQLLDYELPAALRVKTLKQLRISDAQEKAASFLIYASVRNPLTRENFEMAQKQLNLNFEDLELIDATIRAATLNHLYDSAPDLVSKKRWKSLVKKTLNTLQREVPHSGTELSKAFVQVRLKQLLGNTLDADLAKLTNVYSLEQIVKQLVYEGDTHLLGRFLTQHKVPTPLLDDQLEIAARHDTRNSEALVKTLLGFPRSNFSQAGIDAALKVAVEKNTLSVIRYLIQQGAKPRYNVFDKIVSAGRNDALTFFLNDIALSEVQRQEIHSLIKRAIAFGFTDTVQLLLKDGAPITSEETLRLAIEANNWDTFEFLYRERHPKTNPTQLLDLAIPDNKHRPKFLSFLIENAKPSQEKLNQLLRLAAARDNSSAIATLLHHQAKDLDGALKVAIAHQSFLSIYSLIDEGGDPHLENDLALQIALKASEQNIIDYLLQHHPPRAENYARIGALFDQHPHLLKNYHALLLSLIFNKNEGLILEIVPRLKLSKAQLAEYQDMAVRAKAPEVVQALIDISKNRGLRRLTGKLREICRRAFGG